MFKTFGEYMYTLLFSPLRRGRQSLNQFYIFFKVMGRSFDQCKEALLQVRERLLCLPARTRCFQSMARTGICSACRGRLWTTTAGALP